MFDVAFFEVFKEEEQAIKAALPREIHATFTSKTIQEKCLAQPPARLISIRTQSRVPLSWDNNFKGVLTRSRGYDHLLDIYQRNLGKIVCGYLPDYCSRAVAEQSVLMMLMLFRKMKMQIKNFETFNRHNLSGIECKNRQALVVGVGNIGLEIVDILKGLKMKVCGSDIDPRHKNIKYVSLSEGVRSADVVFCALPLTSKTENLFNRSLLKCAKPGFVFVNISRGEIAPIADLQKFLVEGKMAGLGLDVYSDEGALANYLRNRQGKLSAQNRIVLKLKSREDVVFAPHNAFNTQEALKLKTELSIEAVKCFLKRKTFPLTIKRRRIAC